MLKLKLFILSFFHTFPIYKFWQFLHFKIFTLKAFGVLCFSCTGWHCKVKRSRAIDFVPQTKAYTEDSLSGHLTSQ